MKEEELGGFHLRKHRPDPKTNRRYAPGTFPLHPIIKLDGIPRAKAGGLRLPHGIPLSHHFTYKNRRVVKRDSELSRILSQNIVVV